MHHVIFYKQSLSYVYALSYIHKVSLILVVFLAGGDFPRREVLDTQGGV